MNHRLNALIFLTLLLMVSCEESTRWRDMHPTGGPPPIITAIEPGSGFAGNIIDIYGENFSQIPAENLVLFGFSPGTPLVASPEHLQIQLPMINNKQLPVKLAVQGSEFWGYWQDHIDTTLIIPDTTWIDGEMVITDIEADTTLIVDLEFTFEQALSTVSDSVYLPYGIELGPDDSPYIIINETSSGFSKGINRILPNGSLELLRSTYVQGDLVFADGDQFYGNNLRRTHMLGWISRAPVDGSSSFSKFIKNIIQPSGLDIQLQERIMFATTLPYYSDNSYYIEDSLVVDITDIGSYAYWIDMAYIEAYKENSGSSIKFDEVDIDTTSGIHRYDFSRATSCKYHDGYLYITQADFDNGGAIMRMAVLPDGLGNPETILGTGYHIYALEFDSEGYVYFVPRGAATLIRLNPADGSTTELYPGDIVPTADFMSWWGEFLLLVYSNLPVDPAGSAESPGIIQKVYIGGNGYVQ